MDVCVVLTLRLGSGMGVAIYLADLGQIFELLACQTSRSCMLAQYGVLVSGIGEHALFLPVARLVVFVTSFLYSRWCASLCHAAWHSKVGTPCGTDHPRGAVVRSGVVVHLLRDGIIEAAVLALADDAHVLGSVGRLAIGDGDGVVVRLPRRHCTAVQIRTIALTLCLRHKVLFELLLGKMLLILGA